MRGPMFVPQSSPVPPRTPTLLVGLLTNYAQTLLAAAADEYEQFRRNPKYIFWLPKLVNDLEMRVMEAYQKINTADEDLALSYHGRNDQEIRQAIRLALGEAIQPYLTRGYGPDYRPESAPEPPSTDAGVQPQSSSATTPQPQESSEQQCGNRERINNFIQRMATSGLKIKRKDIWQVAGYKDRTEFERFQRGDEHNKSASMNFNRILKMESADFRKQLTKPKQ